MRLAAACTNRKPVSYTHLDVYKRQVILTEQYIKQVEKELCLPRKENKEVVRDWNEVFASALEHGETEQQVIERLGTTKEDRTCKTMVKTDALHKRKAGDRQ